MIEIRSCCLRMIMVHALIVVGEALRHDQQERNEMIDDHQARHQQEWQSEEQDTRESTIKLKRQCEGVII